MLVAWLGLPNISLDEPGVAFEAASVEMVEAVDVGAAVREGELIGFPSRRYTPPVKALVTLRAQRMNTSTENNKRKRKRKEMTNITHND